MYDKSRQHPQPAPPKEQQIQNCQLKTTTILSHAVALWDFFKRKKKKEPSSKQEACQLAAIDKTTFQPFFLVPFLFPCQTISKNKEQ